MAHSKKRKKANRRISDKIPVLMREGKTQRQAVGEAEGMESSGRLRAGGKYIHKANGRGRRKSHRN